MPSNRAQIRRLAYRMGWLGPVLVLWLNASVAHGSTCRSADFESFLTQLEPARGRLQLTVTPNRPEWTVGENVRISVTSPVSGRLVLISIDADGKVYPLFPSAATGRKVDDTVAAGQPVTLPPPAAGYAFQAQPPLGESRLIAIVRPAGARLPLTCAEGLTRGQSIRLVESAKPTPDPMAGPAKASVADPMAGRKTKKGARRRLPGWGLATFSYRIKE